MHATSNHIRTQTKYDLITKIESNPKSAGPGRETRAEGRAKWRQRPEATPAGRGAGESKAAKGGAPTAGEAEAQASARGQEHEGEPEPDPGPTRTMLVGAQGRTRTWARRCRGEPSSGAGHQAAPGEPEGSKGAGAPAVAARLGRWRQIGRASCRERV